MVNKLLEIKDYLIKENPLILILVETWLTNHIVNESIEMNGYNFVRRDRVGKRGGGIVVYYSRDLKVEIIEPQCGSAEVMWLDIKTVNFRFLLGCLYRPPNSSPSLDQELIELLKFGLTFKSDCKKSFDEIIIGGDFNVPNINWETQVSNYQENHFGTKLIDLLDEFGLTQVIREDTRFRGESSSLLDLVITSNKFIFDDIQLRDPIQSSDHKLIVLYMNIEVEGNIKNEEIITYYNFKETNFMDLNNKLKYISLKEMEDINSDLNTAYNKIIERFRAQLLECTPSHTFKRKIQNNTHKWFNKEIFEAKIARSQSLKLYKKFKTLGNFENYKIKRNRVTKLIRKARFHFEKAIVEAAEININNLFRFIKNENRFYPLKISKIKLDGVSYTDNYDIANKFGELYAGDKQESLGTMDNIISGPIYDHYFNRGNIDEIIDKLKNSFSVGSDQISNHVIKNCRTFFVDLIELVMKHFSNKGEIPEQWKEGIIHPKYKKGSKVLLDNYRPVTHLNSISKVGEKLVLKRLYINLSDIKLLRPHQHGFRPGFSCVTNLLEGLNDWTEARDNGEPVGIIYTDLSKAYDRVDRKLLIRKLLHIGIDGFLVKWIHNYLCNRSLRVEVNGIQSLKFENNIGVPQGAVLSSILFNIFVADADTNIVSKTLSYADDFKFYRVIKNDDDAMILQQDINTFANWVKLNNLVLNIEKCVILFLGSNREHYIFKINNVVIKEVTSHNDLGIVVDKKLSFSEHGDKLVCSIRKKLAILKRTFHFLSGDLFRRLFNIYIQPMLDYGSIVYSFSYKKDIEKINRVFRSSSKKLYGFYRLSFPERLKRLKMFSPQQRKLRYDLIFTFKTLQGNNGQEKLFRESIYRPTRGHHKKLAISYCKSLCRKNFITTRVCRWWNGLPNEIVTSTSVSVFKFRLDGYLNNSAAFREMI